MGSRKPKPLAVTVVVRPGPPSPVAAAALRRLFDMLLAPQKEVAPEGGNPGRGEGENGQETKGEASYD